MISRSRLIFRLVAPLLLVVIASSPARAGAVLTLDDLFLTGAPGDLFTVSGSVTNSDATLTELFTFLNPAILSSSVLQITALYAPSTLDVGESYTGNVVTFAILAGAAPGTYPINSFGLSYESINGRTFLSNSLNLSVEVLAPSDIPEPASLWLLSGGLILLVGPRFIRRT